MDGLGYLWVSSYGRNRTGAPRDLYDGDGGNAHPGWNYPLGNRKPDLLQYGSNAHVAGHIVDINAYKGTRDQLAAIFNGTNPTKEEITVSEADRIIKHITDYISGFVGPIGSDTKDVRQQLTGGRDAGDYRGWPQLGKDGQGRDLTVTDAIAAIRHQLVQIQTDINQLKEKK